MIDKVLLKEIGSTIALRIQDRIRSNKIVPPTQKTDGKSTLIDTTRLIKSIRYRVSGKIIYVGSNVIYAKIHHEGGVITPKNAKYLAIPINPIAKGKSPRDFEDTFIKKGVIFRNMGKGKIVALYVLKKKVTIPARPYMFIDNQDKSHIQNLIIEYYQNKIKEVSNGIH